MESYVGELCAEGIKAVALGSTQRPDARTFWNWSYLHGPNDETARALLPHPARRIGQTTDIPPSAHLTECDRSDLLPALDKVNTDHRRRLGTTEHV
ncbi:hypothetical protein [Streptomyces sp. NPDC002825]|uniref:hypothetical protein n=1 Tax=Streptomyces sp. NPDC002825 TaxID=3154666 RepID=UPI00331B21CD